MELISLKVLKQSVESEGVFSGTGRIHIRNERRPGSFEDRPPILDRKNNLHVKILV